MKSLFLIVLFLICTDYVNAEPGINEDKAISIIKKLFKADIESAESAIPGWGKVDIEITLLDLNNDYKNEILFRLLHRSSCGSQGCSTFIIKKTEKNKWQTILSEMITHGDIEVFKETFNKHNIINFGDGPKLKYTNGSYVF